MIEIGRATPAACFSERFHSFFLRFERRVGLELCDQERGPERNRLRIVRFQSIRLLQLESQQISSEGMVHNEMHVLRNEIEDFLIMEPKCRLLVDFDRGRIKDDHVAPVFQGGDVSVHRRPSIGNDRHWD